MFGKVKSLALIDSGETTMGFYFPRKHKQKNKWDQQGLIKEQDLLTGIEVEETFEIDNLSVCFGHEFKIDMMKVLVNWHVGTD
ncbi:hypothetical protein TNCV_2676501 [Trichonephila clavipes]|nr:hypothetical protein TNCV_2676501 [Trichonephila clavipes]